MHDNRERSSSYLLGDQINTDHPLQFVLLYSSPPPLLAAAIYNFQSYPPIKIARNQLLLRLCDDCGAPEI